MFAGAGDAGDHTGKDVAEDSPFGAVVGQKKKDILASI